MSLSSTCPQCMGMTYFTQCGEYTGPDIPSYGISTGMSLDDVIEKLAGISSAELTSQSAEISADKVMSNPTNIGTGSVSSCVLQITKRDFTYNLGPNRSGVLFSYDFTELLNALPPSYSVGVIQVKATGRESAGSSVIATMSSPSSGFSVELSRYPVTVDILIRLTTECGNVDLTATLNLISSGNLGTYRHFLDAVDLTTGSTNKSTTLDAHLQSIEYAMMVLDRKVNLVDMQSANNRSMNNEVAITGLEETVSNPSKLQVDYFDTENSNDELTNVLNNLFSKIKTLEEEKAQQDIKIGELEALVDSLNTIAQ